MITSREKQFGLVTFVDTPGLVDGDMKYPFDVEKTLIWLGMREMGGCVAVWLGGRGTPAAPPCRRVGRPDPSLLRSHGPGTLQENTGYCWWVGRAQVGVVTSIGLVG